MAIVSCTAGQEPAQPSRGDPTEGCQVFWAVRMGTGPCAHLPPSPPPGTAKIVSYVLQKAAGKP